MAEKTVIVCDVCDKQKGVANHWWRGRVVEATQTIVIIAANSLQTRQTGDVDLCGRQHLNTWLNKKLDKMGKEPIDAFSAPSISTVD